ncbi:MAG TPA: hypothetical protein PLU71_04805 [Candidatus Dependentiae bacterium]|nr:hypothetical protein [Candidatus Dependentiae bacterium]HRQ63154.1 hypothetical protein [Candidatus Dependentiae bacterium]
MKYMILIFITIGCFSNLIYPMQWRSGHTIVRKPSYDQLPIMVVEECCICMEEKEVHQIACASVINHTDKICDVCLDLCRKQTGTCPLCRSQLIVTKPSFANACKQAALYMYELFSNKICGCNT